MPATSGSRQPPALSVTVVNERDTASTSVPEWSVCPVSVTTPETSEAAAPASSCSVITPRSRSLPTASARGRPRGTKPVTLPASVYEPGVTSLKVKAPPTAVICCCTVWLFCVSRSVSPEASLSDAAAREPWIRAFAPARGKRAAPDGA